MLKNTPKNGENGFDHTHLDAYHFCRVYGKRFLETIPEVSKRKEKKRKTKEKKNKTKN